MEVTEGIADQGCSVLKVRLDWAGCWPCSGVEGGGKDMGAGESFAWAGRTLPTEAGLREAIHLTCLGRCVQHPCGFSGILAILPDPQTPFVQGKAYFSDGCKQHLLTETHPCCALGRKAWSLVTGPGPHSKGC